MVGSEIRQTALSSGGSLQPLAAVSQTDTGLYLVAFFHARSCFEKDKFLGHCNPQVLQSTCFIVDL
jgi:hypothetical protein